MPITPNGLDIVQLIKQEWTSLGGGEGSDFAFSVPLTVIQDAPEVPCVFFVDVGRRNRAIAIWPHGNNLRFRDITNPGIDGKGYSLSNLLTGTGITEESHKTLLQLIHFINEGPAEGFATGATKTVTGTVFPTQELWRRADTTKLVEKNITWTGVNPITIEWIMYAVDGIAVLATVTDTITYSGVFETSRTRAIA